jgi:hypothetical protein
MFLHTGADLRGLLLPVAGGGGMEAEDQKASVVVMSWGFWTGNEGQERSILMSRGKWKNRRPHSSEELEGGSGGF